MDETASPNAVAETSAVPANIENQTETPIAAPSLDKKQSLAYSGVRKQLIAVVCAQILMLTGFAAPKAYTLATGRVVTLQAEPVDPYDMFRGEYASLRYKDLSLLKGDKDLCYNDQVFVLLTKRGNDWVPTSVSKKKSVPLRNQVILSGTIDGAPYPEYKTNEYVVPVRYGIEHLYTPQGKSANLQANAAKLNIDVAVDSWGNACIRRVVLDGREIYDGLSMFNPFS